MHVPKTPVLQNMRAIRILEILGMEVSDVHLVGLLMMGLMKTVGMYILGLDMNPVRLR